MKDALAIPAEGMPDGNIPNHVAIIMDGNGRWAEQRGLPRTAGHKQGVESVRKVVRAAGDIGVKYLTLYSFSTENWNRPDQEISDLFSLLRMFIRRDLADLHKNNVRILVIGGRKRIPQDILSLLDEAVNLTANNTGPTLILAFNYGARDEIVNAAREMSIKVAKGEMLPDAIDEKSFAALLNTDQIPDPDLLIRTSGEMRLSNFLLWQLAYSELVFMDCLWPDFGENELLEAIDVYKGRNRKFGCIGMELPS